MVGFSPSSWQTATPTGPAASLTLHVRSQRGTNQTVRVERGRLRIGSSAECDLLLRDLGVDPVQCLIVGGEQRTILRNFSKHTRLNGLPVEEAVLAPGDRMVIGSVDIDVTEGDAPRESKAKAEPAAAQELEQARVENEHQSAALEARVAELDEREAQLAQRLRESAAREADLEQRTVEASAREAQLDSRHVELGRRHEELVGRERQLQQIVDSYDQRSAELEQCTVELNARDVQLESRDSELGRRHEELVGRERQLQQIVDSYDQRSAELTRWDEELTSRLQKLDEAESKRQQYLADEQGQLDSVRGALEEQRNQLLGELCGRSAELDQREQNLAGERAALAAECENIQQEHANLAQRHSELDARHGDAGRWQAELDGARHELTQVRAEQERDREHRAGLETSVEQFETQRQTWQAERVQFEQTLADHSREIEHHRSEVTRLAGSLRDAAEQATTDETNLARRQAELDRELAGIEPTRTELETTRRDFETRTREVAERTEKLEAAFAELQAAREQFAQQREQHNADLRQSQALRDELIAAGEELESHRAEMKAREQHAEQVLLDRKIELDHKEEELATWRAQLARQAATIREADETSRQREAAAEPNEDQPSSTCAANSGSAAEATSVFRRLQAAGIWRAKAQPEESPLSVEDGQRPVGEEIVEESIAEQEVEPCDNISETEGEATMPTERSPLAPVVTIAAEDEGGEESIDQYMVRLLERSRQNNAETGSVGKPTARPTTRAPEAPAAKVVAPPPAENAQAVAGEAQPAAEPKRKSRTMPTGDLSAMRELANMSTKAALETHARERHKNMVYSKAAVAMTALAAGFYLMLASPRGGAAWYGGAIALLASVFWALQLGVVTGYIHIQASGGMVLDLWRRVARHVDHAAADAPAATPEPNHLATADICTAIVVDEATVVETSEVSTANS